MACWLHLPGRFAPAPAAPSFSAVAPEAPPPPSPLMPARPPVMPQALARPDSRARGACAHSRPVPSPGGRVSAAGPGRAPLLAAASPLAALPRRAGREGRCPPRCSGRPLLRAGSRPAGVPGEAARSGERAGRSNARSPRDPTWWRPVAGRGASRARAGAGPPVPEGPDCGCGSARRVEGRTGRGSGRAWGGAAGAFKSVRA